MTRADITPAATRDNSSAETAGEIGRQRVHYDAGLLLYFGLKPPVGIVRVEQYVAEHLARDPALAVDFVVFDQEMRAYRPLWRKEQALLERILFRRYDATPDEPEEDEPPPPPAPPPPTLKQIVLRKLATAARLGDAEFDALLPDKLGRRLPTPPGQSPLLRFPTRVARRLLLILLRLLHRGLRAWGPREWVNAPPPPAPPVDPAERPVPFAPGDSLISIANTWDYMDYAYLARIVRQDGVRFISVIYDVIAMEMPYVTPGAVHVYHRHWVELGHLADRLIAISRHSRDMYRRFIAAPNDIDPPIACAYLPNFLFDRQSEIGEEAVPRLQGRRFVVFCSTIETRKNHPLLVHLWDRLRQEIPPETLPVLVFVGGWGWGIEYTRLLTERNWRLREHLMVLNHISDAELIWLYRNARFTVFPAFAEGFGLAAAESLSFGTPVVVSSCPALNEATEGLMPRLDPLDFPGWLAEMRRLILDDAYLASLREAARGHVGAGYDDFAHAIRAAILPDGGAEQQEATACRNTFS